MLENYVGAKGEPINDDINYNEVKVKEVKINHSKEINASEILIDEKDDEKDDMKKKTFLIY